MSRVDWVLGILLQFSPHSGISILVEFDVDQIGSAADWTILNILLTGTLRYIKWSDDLLAAGFADVAGFVFHRLVGNRRERSSITLRQALEQKNARLRIQYSGTQ